jgi:hypothetical protein
MGMARSPSRRDANDNKAVAGDNKKSSPRRRVNASSRLGHGV